MNTDILKIMEALGMRDAYKCFIAAANYMVESGEKSQKELAAEVDVTPQHLNAILRERESRPGKKISASMTLQQNIAEQYGYSLAQFLEFGQGIIDGEPIQDKGQITSNERRASYSKTEAPPVESLYSFITAFQQKEKDIIFWEACVNATSAAICIIDSDKNVKYQNQANRILYGKTQTDKELCSSCLSDKGLKHPCESCPVDKAFEMRVEAAEFTWINDNYYNVNAIPFQANGDSYVLVATISVNLIAKAEKTIDSMLEQIYYLLNSAPYPLLFADKHKNILYINKMFKDLFNVKRGELQRTEDFRTMLGIKLSEPREALTAAIDTRENGATNIVKVEIVGRGTHWIEFTAATGSDDQFIGVQVKVFDKDSYKYFAK